MPTYNILLVDDENNILNSLRRLLRKEEGYKIFTATSGKDGLQIIQQQDNIALVISDQKMPGMDGITFLGEVRKASQDTIRIMLTGYTSINIAMEAINKGEIYRFIAKPWDELELKTTIRHALAQYELVTTNKRLNELTTRQNIELQRLNTTLEKKVEDRTAIILQKKEELDRLYKELAKNFFDSIHVFVGILELYNPSLGSHSKKTAVLARMMAINMRLTEQEVEDIEIAAVLHDIGMIGVPKEISDAEVDTLEGDKLNIYKQHPVIGQDILKHIEKLDTIGMIIRSHHERMDGNGYPDGLKDELIPIGAKIIAVADFYDELHNEISDNNLIRDTIQEQSEKRFDPNIVGELFRVINTLRRNISKEIPVPVEKITEGMVISRDIYTGSGIVLAVKNTILNKIHINKIKNYRQIGQLADKVYIYHTTN